MQIKPNPETTDNIETVEEFDYVAPDLTQLYSTSADGQPDGIYEAEGVNVTVFSSNCSLTDEA